MTEIRTRRVNYRDGQTECFGHLALPPGDGPFPVVLINHAWAGQSDFERDKAEALARLGYAGFAADNYGGGRVGANPEENRAMMKPLIADRAVLRQRLLSALTAARAIEEVDASRVAAIGFCFGGLCALDVARSGADLRGVVSFHGLLSPAGLSPQKILAKVLVLHGYDDPSVPPEAAMAFASEMSRVGADWQLHAYGGTMHAFTNPLANSPASGLLYSEPAARRSWQSMTTFLEEVFA